MDKDMNMTDEQETRYAEFLMANRDEVFICNGDDLILAMEEGVLLEEFLAQDEQG
jgi:hypothetical protein